MQTLLTILLGFLCTHGASLAYEDSFKTQPCHVIATDPEQPNEDGTDSGHIHCFTDNPLGYREKFEIELTSQFINDHADKLQQGTLYVQVDTATGTVYTEGASTVLATNQKTFASANAVIQQQGSVNLLRVGRKKLLVVRVVSAHGEEPKETMADLEGAIFGTGIYAQGNNVVDQWDSVSHGQITFSPAISFGASIQRGVAQVRISEKVEGADVHNVIYPAVLRQAALQLGSLDDLADQVIFCLPDGSITSWRNNWFAFSYLFEPYSFYQRSRCLSMSHVIHEMGHSMGFHHSGLGTDEYADESGYMGYSIFQLGTPIKAFNAHKHWISEWFPTYLTQSIDTTKMASSVTKLLSFTTDFERVTGDHKLLMQVNQNLYLHYNGKESYNANTPAAFANRVLVVRADNDVGVSYSVARLDRGESYRSDDGVIIEVCSSDDNIGVAVYTTSGFGSPCLTPWEDEEYEQPATTRPPIVTTLPSPTSTMPPSTTAPPPSSSTPNGLMINEELPSDIIIEIPSSVAKNKEPKPNNAEIIAEAGGKSKILMILLIVIGMSIVTAICSMVILYRRWGGQYNEDDEDILYDDKPVLECVERDLEASDVPTVISSRSHGRGDLSNSSQSSSNISPDNNEPMLRTEGASESSESISCSSDSSGSWDSSDEEDHPISLPRLESHEAAYLSHKYR